MSEDDEQREIDADRRAEWWLPVYAGVAVVVVAVLVALGEVHGVGP